MELISQHRLGESGHASQNSDTEAEEVNQGISRSKIPSKKKSCKAIINMAEHSVSTEGQLSITGTQRMEGREGLREQERCEREHQSQGGSIPITSSSPPCYPSKTPSSNTTTLETQASMHESGGHTHSVHSSTPGLNLRLSVYTIHLS